MIWTEEAGPHRVLRLSDPLMSGEDVREVQESLRVAADGWYGPQTRSAYRTTGWEMGLAESTLEAGCTIGAQRIIRGMAEPTDNMKKRAEKRRQTVRQPKPEFTVRVRNRSVRGARIVRIVHHTTEGRNISGLADLRGLANWFDNPRSEVSSTIGVDAEGNDCRMLYDSDKPWTQASFNPGSLSNEQIGFARQSSFPEKQIVTSAVWTAFWHLKHGIPLKFGIQAGVCEHKHLGKAGGGHSDCGPNFPLAKLINLSRKMATEMRKRHVSPDHSLNLGVSDPAGLDFPRDEIIDTALNLSDHELVLAPVSEDEVLSAVEVEMGALGIEPVSEAELAASDDCLSRDLRDEHDKQIALPPSEPQLAFDRLSLNLVPDDEQ